MGRKAYIKEAAQALDLTDYQLRRMAKEKKIPFLMSGTRYIFDIEQCEEFLKNEAMRNVMTEENVKQYGVLRRIDG
jgi:excisionase family DNA binding protein